MVVLSFRHSLGSVQIREIADAHGIPQHYLEQILVVLKKAGLVESQRGSQGGYTLARPPSRISVLEILECLEGSLEIVPSQRREGPLAGFWKKLDDGIRGTLDLSLEDLASTTRAARETFTYMI